MMYAAAALGVFAGLASASHQHQHPRQFQPMMYPRNETAYPTATPTGTGVLPGSPSTTLTVGITRTETITSCAPTVTNCPTSTNGGKPAIVTEVVDLTTTVCPVDEASTISEGIISSHSSGLLTGSTRTVTVVPTQGEPTGPKPTQGQPTQTEDVKPTTGVTEETLTMTVGPSSSKSILTTTILSTYTEMVTLTRPGSGNGVGNGNGNEEEPTTTTTMTSTGTRTVTVPPADRTNDGTSDFIGSDDSDNGACDCPSAGNTVTVTETQPASTVYVTAPAPTASNTQTVEDNSPVPTGGAGNGNGNNDNETGNGNGENDSEEGADEDDEEEYEECDDEEDVEDEEPEVTATATVVPYPTGGPNGPTVPTGGPNGTYPVPTGYPTRPFRR